MKEINIGMSYLDVDAIIFSVSCFCFCFLLHYDKEGLDKQHPFHLFINLLIK